MMQVIIQFFKDMSPAKLAASVLTIFTFLILAAIYLSKLSNNDFAILYSDLDMQDSAKIVEELESKNIPFQAANDGSIIKVHRSEVVNVRLALAREGLPNSGSVIGYEIFDKEDSIGSTNFSQNIKLVRALEGELSRTISAFEQVDKARVHLVIPQREIFSKEKMEPRASVVIKFKGSRRLGKSEIDAISHLIVTAVPGLSMEGVTIVDTKGKALKIGASEEGEFSGGKNEEVRIAAEERLRQIIENLLESTLGAGKVKARVALEMNFDRIVTNSELYDPDSAVVRSTQAIDEHEQTPVVSGEADDASVANNIPGGGAAGTDLSKFAIVDKSDQTTNYEISKTIKNHISESGLIKKMSIGILVDGQYKLNPNTKEMEYSPRSQEDLDKIANLVKVAVGFEEDRNDKLEVINMKFSSDLGSSEDEDSDWLKEELPGLFQTLIFAIVVLLVLITVIRPIALKAFESRKHAGEDVLGPISDSLGGALISDTALAGQMTELSSESGGEVVQTEAKKAASDSIIQRVNDIVETHPQDLVNVLRKWLNEGN